MYYGYLDAFMVLLLIAGYFWVNSFIRDEFETIKKNTVTAGGKEALGVSMFPSQWLRSGKRLLVVLPLQYIIVYFFFGRLVLFFSSLETYSGCSVCHVYIYIYTSWGCR